MSTDRIRSFRNRVKKYKVHLSSHSRTLVLTCFFRFLLLLSRSVKLKNPDNTNRSIAHFYRHVELFPYLNPAVVLSSAPRPVSATASKGLFLGGSGKVHLTASLHRTTWVAGQRVHINVGVLNETTKKVKSLTLSLIRTVTLFRPRPELNVGRSSSNPNSGSSSEDWNHDAYVDPDACNTSTSRKKIGEETLEMGQKGSKGFVTAKGWWTGVEAGGEVDFSHYMCLPVSSKTHQSYEEEERLFYSPPFSFLLLCSDGCSFYLSWPSRRSTVLYQGFGR